VAAGRIGAQLAAWVLHTAKHVQTTKVHSLGVLPCNQRRSDFNPRSHDLLGSPLIVHPSLPASRGCEGSMGKRPSVYKLSVSAVMTTRICTQQQHRQGFA
jgi:hypothetical protein